MDAATKLQPDKINLTQQTFQQAPTTNLDISLRIFLLIISVAFLPLNLIGNGGLIQFVKNERKIQKTASKLFILAIAYTSFIGSTIGKFARFVFITVKIHQACPYEYEVST